MQALIIFRWKNTQVGFQVDIYISIYLTNNILAMFEQEDKLDHTSVGKKYHDILFKYMTWNIVYTCGILLNYIHICVNVLSVWTQVSYRR